MAEAVGRTTRQMCAKMPMAPEDMVEARQEILVETGRRRF